MKRSDIEIMAPVGSYESLMAAIQGNANSVYFGVEQLNMRARSSNNFTLEDLKNIVNICKENNIKSYLTVNTIIYNNELKLMSKILDAAKQSDITAIIASDIAVINYANTIDLNVHISTQVNISNIEAVKFYSKFSDVMVTARELNLDQVSEICKQIETQNIRGKNGNLVQIEIFAHGALCMAVSGKCYLSLHEYSHSANRGSCLQNCRRGYLLKDFESDTELHIDEKYIMSPKDLKTIHFLNKIIDAGVKVLKIEGRARSAEYVKVVCETYHEALCAIENKTYTENKISEWNKKLETVFNRGFWNGYYLGQKLGEWSSQYGSSASKKKVYVGKVTNFFTNLNVVEVLVEAADLEINSELWILGSTTGAINVVATEMRVDDASVNLVKKGEKFSMKVNELLRRSDKVYKFIEC